MNIFVLDNDITECVKYHVDKHVVKMISEYSQLLATTIELTTGNQIKVSDCDIDEFNLLYPNKIQTIKKTHDNHPSAKWVRESRENFDWLMSLLDALHSEWIYRYGHSTDKIHCSYYKLMSGYIEPKLPKIGLTPFKLAMPEEYQSSNAIESYRKYYNNDKQHLFNWKKRDVPNWIEII